jgi:hypothetical protein
MALIATGEKSGVFRSSSTRAQAPTLRDETG